MPMQVAPPDDQLCNWGKCRHLVDNFTTKSGGNTGDKCKWHNMVVKFGERKLLSMHGGLFISSDSVKLGIRDNSRCRVNGLVPMCLTEAQANLPLKMKIKSIIVHRGYSWGCSWGCRNCKVCYQIQLNSKEEVGFLILYIRRYLFYLFKFSMEN